VDLDHLDDAEGGAGGGVLLLRRNIIGDALAEKPTAFTTTVGVKVGPRSRAALVGNTIVNVETAVVVQVRAHGRRDVVARPPSCFPALTLYYPVAARTAYAKHPTVQR
jgi:hypothetical protein